MNQGTTKVYDEFVFRRLREPISLFGLDLPPNVWLFVLFGVLLVGAIYVGIMYIRDSRGVGVLWAGLLGMLRLGVYAALALVFLLPAKQNWQETSASSKVIVLFDVSGSMDTRDDIPAPGVEFDKLPTRSDKLMTFIQDPRADFFGKLTQKNPVSVYRIAAGLDPNPIYFDRSGRTWSKEEYVEYEEQLKKGAPQPAGAQEKRPLSESHWKEFLIPNKDPNAKPFDAPEDMSKNEGKRLEQLYALNKMLAGRRFFSATNLGDATLNSLNLELNNMVQGIVIFTDGRSTEGSDDAFSKIADLAKKANIPIFVVGIGEVRPQVKLDITDLRAPQMVQPEDKWPVVLEVTGEGLADKELLPPPELHITYTRKKDDGKIERLHLYLVEKEDKKTPKKPSDKPGDKPVDPDTEKAHETIELNEEIILRPEAPVKFDSSNPPRLEIEFTVDAATLAKANNPPIDLATDPRYKGKKWEIGETAKEGAIHLQAVVAKDKLELTPLPIHKSDLVDVSVRKRALRVLLFASAATHDFQFLNNMLIREVEQQRAQLAVYVQPPPGKDSEEYYKSIVLGVPPDRLLNKFPDKYDEAGDGAEKEKVYDLSEYDAIVAFDPDWTKLSEEQLKLVSKWANAGGGIVMVGGPINTLQLARPGLNREKLKPILELLPVILRDVRIDAMDRSTESPWPLSWDKGATPDLEFLKLTDDGDPNNWREGWNEFFYGNKEGMGPKKRGFYNFYPSDSVKQGAIIVARFTDTTEPKTTTMKDNTQMPYIVLSGPGTSRVVWLAWGETRRLRQHSEAFYERFWVKLLRYTGSNNQTNLVKRVRLDMNRTFTAGKYVQLDAKISAKKGEPLFVRDNDEKKMPTITLKLPAGVKDDEIPLTYKLVPRKVKDDNDKGKFSLRFQVKSPGDYQLELKVPETGDSVIQKFNVKESNPELDDTRPDFNQMYRLASDAEQVLARIPVEAERLEVKRHLVPPALSAEDKDKNEKDDEFKTGKPRLYFNLKDAELIPLCMKTVTDTKQVRGKYEDVWDESWTRWNFHVFGYEVHLDWLFNSLLLIVGLLSTEWLIRKLLRLA